MNHTIITLDLASIHRLNERGMQLLMSRLNQEVRDMDTLLDLDEWKTTVVQVSPTGEQTGIPGYRLGAA